MLTTQYLTEWLAAKGDIRPGTRHSYAGHIRNYLIPYLGHHRLGVLRIEHVAGMLSEVPGSDATRQRVRATLRAALSDAQRQGLVTVNVAALVKLPAGKRPKALVWTVEREARWREAVAAHVAAGKTPTEARDLAPRPSAVMVWLPDHLGVFLDAAAGERLYALFHLIAYRGLRRGEAAGLEWQDVNLDGAALAVRRQRTTVGWEVVEHAPKSEAGERTVPLDAGTVALSSPNGWCGVQRGWTRARSSPGRTGSRRTQPRSTTGSTNSWPQLTSRRYGYMTCGTAPRR